MEDHKQPVKPRRERRDDPRKDGRHGEDPRRDGPPQEDPRQEGPYGEDARKRRWRGHREARRATMVEAAIRAVRRHGAGVGMDDIAAEAGVSKPVLYRHFTDQADLYVAVGRRVADMLVAMLAPELEQGRERGREPRELVAAAIDAYLRAIEAEPELYRFVVRRSLVNRPVEHDPVTDYSTLIATQVARIVGERLRSAGLDSGAAEPWGHGIVGLVQAAGDWWLERRSMDRASLTEYLTTLIWSGFSGVLAPAAAPAQARPLRVVPDERGRGDEGARGR